MTLNTIITLSWDTCVQAEKEENMQKSKIEAITNQLNCHKGAFTLKNVWAALPTSCENLPRNIIADILNACNKSFHAGAKEKEEEIKDVLGHDWWMTSND